MTHQTYMQGPTAHGGDYSIIFWRDRRGRPTAQSKAVQVVVVEYLSSGEEICRTQAGLESYLVEELRW